MDTLPVLCSFSFYSLAVTLAKLVAESHLSNSTARECIIYRHI